MTRGVTLNEGLAQRGLGGSVVIHEGGVEIGSTTSQENAHHLLELLDVYAGLVLGVEQRQAHAPKTEFWNSLQVFSHKLPSNVYRTILTPEADFKSRTGWNYPADACGAAPGAYNACMFAFRRALRSALAAHPDDELVNLDTPGAPRWTLPTFYRSIRGPTFSAKAISTSTVGGTTP